MAPNLFMAKLATENVIKETKERIEEDMENDGKEMKEELEERDLNEIRTGTANEPINDCLTKQQIAEIVVLKVLTLISYISRKGTGDKLKLRVLAIEQTTAISVWTNYSSLENTADSFPENRLPFFQIVATEVRNSTHEFHVQLDIFAESSVYMKGFRDAYVLFQLAMQEDSNKCHDKVAMNNLENVLANGRRRLNEKGPRSRVHFSQQIFEEACRDAGISVAPMPNSESEDLLAYNLHFPSGCRMVLAIPMNNPEKK